MLNWSSAVFGGVSQRAKLDGCVSNTQESEVKWEGGNTE